MIKLMIIDRTMIENLISIEIAQLPRCDAIIISFKQTLELHVIRVHSKYARKLDRANACSKPNANNV